MKKVLILILLFAGTAYSQYSNLGSAGAQFLQIPLGAKEAAMGGAVVGLMDNSSAVFWNPAGLAKITNWDAQFSYLRWFDLFDLSAGAVGYNLPDIGAVALSFVSFSTGKIEITDERNPNGTGRFYDAQDFALGATYSRFLTDKFTFGLTVKYVYQRIWNETADGFAFDVGTQYTLDFNNLTIAMCMSNFGADLQFEGPDLDLTHSKDPSLPLSRLAPAELKTDPFALPLHFQVGLGIDLYTSDFFKARFGLDVTHPNDNVERINTGTELAFFDRIYLRGGYRFNYDVEKFSFGAGANLPLGDMTVRFDYAYSVFDILPNVQRISFGVKF